MLKNKAKTLEDTLVKKRKNFASFEKNKKRRTAEASTTEMQELVKKRKNVASFEKNKKRRTAEASTTEMQELKLKTTTQEKMEFDEIGGQDHKIDWQMGTQPGMTENNTTKSLINNPFGPSCSDPNSKSNKKEQTNFQEKKPTPKEKIEFSVFGEQDRKIDCPMETQTCMTGNKNSKNRTNDPFGPSCSNQKYKSNKKEQQNLNKKKPIQKEKSTFLSLLNKTKVEESCESPPTWPKYVGPKLKKKPGEKKFMRFRHIVFPDSSDSDQDLDPYNAEPSAIPWEKSSTNLHVNGESKNNFHLFSDSSSDFDIFNDDFPPKILTDNVEEAFYSVVQLKDKPRSLEE